MINQENYYEDKSHITNSMLGWLKQSPAFFKHMLAIESKPTESMIFGTAFHCYVLENDKFNDEYYIMPKTDRRTKAGKEAYAMHMDAAAGKSIITTDQFNTILGMAEAINSNKTLKGLLNIDGSKYESVNTWTERIHSDDGINESIDCKSLIDLRVDSEDIVVDLKTTSSVNAFTGSVRKYGYHRQAAFYLRGLQANGLVSHNARFIFLVVEKTAPYEVGLFEVTPEILDIANEDIDYLLKLYAECRAKDKYPKKLESFDGTIEPIELTPEHIL